MGSVIWIASKENQFANQIPFAQGTEESSEKYINDGKEYKTWDGFTLTGAVGQDRVAQGNRNKKTEVTDLKFLTWTLVQHRSNIATTLHGFPLWSGTTCQGIAHYFSYLGECKEWSSFCVVREERTKQASKEPYILEIKVICLRIELPSFLLDCRMYRFIQ